MGERPVRVCDRARASRYSKKGGLDAALRDMRCRLPDFKVYSMGEYHWGSAYAQAGVFFCGIERRHGGGAYVGQGRTYAQAVERAVALASEPRR